MRIVIDMQGAQTPFSRHRGVGRYTLGLIKALALKSHHHDVFLALNGAFPEGVSSIRDAFRNVLPQRNIRVWQQFYDCAAIDPALGPAKCAAEVSREVFLNHLDPDIIFSTNLQEGLFDPAPTSVRLLPSKALFCSTLHDVIPLVYPERYLTLQPITDLYNEKIEGIRKSDIVLTVSKNSKKEIIERVGVPSERIAVIYNAIDHLTFKRHAISAEKRQELLSRLGICKEFLLYTGGGDAHKNLNRLYEAFAKLPIDLKNSYQLVMVGKELKNERGVHLSVLKKHRIDDRVIFTGYLEDDDLVALYNLCALFVFPSLHEGFGLPPLEAMACGVPVIAANAASLPEVVRKKDALFDPYDSNDISQKIERVLTDAAFREQLISDGLSCAASFSWDNGASKLLDLFDSVRDKVIRKANHSSSVYITQPVQTAVERIAAQPAAALLKNRELIEIAASLSETYPEDPHRSTRLFLDVSAMIENGDHTGIQRVVRAICFELVRESVSIQAVPVYTNTDNHEFYRAGELIDTILGNSSSTTENVHIEFCAGDILLYLDLHPAVAISHVEKNRYLRNKGVSIYHIVYDLLPARFPHYFWPALCDEFLAWLKAISHSDGAVCISQAVAHELHEWMDANLPKQKELFTIGWFHLGADIENSIPTFGIPVNGNDTIELLASGSSFLVVGTIEPRKGQSQIIDAFERLWAADMDINLVMVGKEGWGMRKFAERLLSHPQQGERLFWLEKISDEYLEKLYASCICLIAASEGEGFGLPLIEAARHKIPIIARDIPVFREVAGEHAFYFSGRQPQDLAEAVRDWIDLYREGRAPASGDIPRLTWRQSAEQLIGVIMEYKNESNHNSKYETSRNDAC